MATTFRPQYSTLASGVLARGGPRGSADLDIRTGSMGRDALGNPSLVSGGERIVSVLMRALLTPRGADPFDPAYGSDALPGRTVTTNLMLQVANAALYVIRRAGGAALGLASVRVDAVQQADPRNADVTVTLTMAGGAAFPAVLQVPV